MRFGMNKINEYGEERVAITDANNIYEAAEKLSIYIDDENSNYIIFKLNGKSSDITLTIGTLDNNLMYYNYLRESLIDEDLIDE